MSEMSDRIRHDFKASDDVRDKGLTTPANVIRYDDIVYGDSLKWQSLDVYRPKEAGDKNLPVIFSVHGGGWVYGDKERYQYYCMSLAQHGFAVVNFTYRLAPEYKFPAALEDINLIVKWIMEHYDEYHFDTEHIFAVGDSAGAHQLGLYCAICTNPDYAKEFEFKVVDGFVPTAIALNCGVYQIQKEANDSHTIELMKEYLPEGGTPKEMQKIDVTRYITSDFPPTFYMTSSGDFLNNQAVILTQAFMEKKVPCELHFYGDADNKLEHVFHCNMKRTEAAVCNKEECDFFKKFL